MADYRNLKAWQHSRQLAVECSKATRRFPAYEQDALSDQLRRSSYSVPINIAEGSTRRGSREYRKYLDTARASLAEVETILAISHDLGYIEPRDYARLDALVNETGKTLYGLLRKISDAAARPAPAPGPDSRSASGRPGD